jgi:hypothetical protein
MPGHKSLAHPAVQPFGKLVSFQMGLIDPWGAEIHSVAQGDIK